MSLKSKLIEAGVCVYVAGCTAAGIFAGKSFYELLHTPDQPFSWLKAVLAVFVGAGIAGVLGIPTHRYALSKCPECESGRLRKTKETLETCYGKGGFHYYGIVLPDVEINKIRETIFCDRCNYKTVREDEEYG